MANYKWIILYSIQSLIKRVTYGINPKDTYFTQDICSLRDNYTYSNHFEKVTNNPHKNNSSALSFRRRSVLNK